jgi:hypothetical protein
MMVVLWSIPLVPDEYQLYAKVGLAALVALYVVRRVWRRVQRFRRSRKPVVLHPSLQKYGINPEEAARQRRELAAQIVATSSGERLAGYEIVQQIEAVFVEGFRTPADAVEGLKAVAARCGANAVVNVRPERSVVGKCSASGDAVRVKRIAVEEQSPDQGARPVS